MVSMSSDRRPDVSSRSLLRGKTLLLRILSCRSLFQAIACQVSGHFQVCASERRISHDLKSDAKRYFTSLFSLYGRLRPLTEYNLSNKIKLNSKINLERKKARKIRNTKGEFDWHKYVDVFPGWTLDREYIKAAASRVYIRQLHTHMYIYITNTHFLPSMREFYLSLRALNIRECYMYNKYIYICVLFLICNVFSLSHV